MQMKQGYHLFLLTAKCFLQEAKSRWESDIRKNGPQCDISGLMNASGRFTPSFFIFRRVNFDQRLMLNASSEAAAIAKQNG